MRAYTDYPILSLGDVAGEEAPIREVIILYYDQDKRCKVLVGGVEEEIKTGYLYTKPVRSDEAYEKDFIVNTQYIKNSKGHYKSSKAAQITKSYVVYGPNYSPNSGQGPFYYRFLDKAWKRACALGKGSHVSQWIEVHHRDGGGYGEGGGVYWEVE